MGFPMDFDSTKVGAIESLPPSPWKTALGRLIYPDYQLTVLLQGKKVEGAANMEASKVKTRRRARQYMNRRGDSERGSLFVLFYLERRVLSVRELLTIFV